MFISRDSQIYHMKIEEYKREQQNMRLQLKSYNDENQNDLVIGNCPRGTGIGSRIQRNLRKFEVG